MSFMQRVLPATRKFSTSLATRRTPSVGIDIHECAYPVSGKTAVVSELKDAFKAVKSGDHIVVHGIAATPPGIGAIPDAALAALKDHKDLGIHTEMFSDGVLDLVRNNVITNSKKAIHPGKLVGSVVYGFAQIRHYGAKAPLSLKTLEERIILVLSLYDKIDPKKLTMDSTFVNDLGLDSLDHVEVIMALEDEFGFEIPDGDADRMKTPRDIFKYICDKEDVYE